MMLRSAARTDVGRKRRANEDCYAIAAELGYYAVADGMGGHRAGQLARGVGRTDEPGRAGPEEVEPPGEAHFEIRR